MSATLTLWISLCLSLLFAASAIPKFRRPAAFRDSVGVYPFVPKPAVAAVAVIVPVVELVIAFALLLAATRAIALYAASAMLAVYCVAVAAAWKMGAGGEDCGCSGEEGVPIGGWLLVRNVGLLAFSLVGASLPANGAVGVAGAAIVLVLVVAAVLVYDWANVFIRSEYETD